MENFIKRAFSAFLLAPITIFALMEGHQVVKGSASETFPDPKTQQIHASDKTVINCSKFNIAKDEKVYFKQDNPKHSVLCRVKGKDPSIIQGNLKADGRLILINPMSIIFREHAFVEAHHLLASTLDMRDEDFLNDKYKFFLSKHAENSCIANLGKIDAMQTVLMAPQLVNRGTILGRVAFLGGKEITINFEGDEKFSFVIDEPLQSGFAEIAGDLKAPGKDVLVRHRTAQHLISSVVNANGLIEATKMERVNGAVRLVAPGMIEADTLTVEGRTIEKAIDLKIKKKANLMADQELRWQGGSYESLNPGKTELSLQAEHGKVILAAAIGNIEQKKESPYDKISIRGKSIDQNYNIKTRSGIVYTGNEINLAGDVVGTPPFKYPETEIVFNGPVIVKNNIKITTGQTKGKVQFNGTLDSDDQYRNLNLDNGKSSGTIVCNHPIGTKGQFGTLTIIGGNLSLHNVGGQSAGAKRLEIHNPKNSFELLGSIYRAGNQEWYCTGVNLKSSNPVSFISDNGSMVFINGTTFHLNLEGKVHFDVQGGDLKLPYLSLSEKNLSGNKPFVSINAHRGDVTFDNVSGCALNVKGHHIYLNGEINVTSLMMEAEKGIKYLDRAELTGINASEDLSFSVKEGTIGSEKRPLKINTTSMLWVGGKSISYFEGKCKYDYPHYLPHPPVTVYLNGRPNNPAVTASIVAKEEVKIESISSNLDHLIPHGFVDETAFIPQRAPLFYLQGIPKLVVSTEEDTESEKTE